MNICNGGSLPTIPHAVTYLIIFLDLLHHIWSLVCRWVMWFLPKLNCCCTQKASLLEAKLSVEKIGRTRNMFLYNQFLKWSPLIKMKVSSSSLSISFQVYYGQTPLHLKNDWELVFREAQLQALERQSVNQCSPWKFGWFFSVCKLVWRKWNTLGRTGSSAGWSSWRPTSAWVSTAPCSEYKFRFGAGIVNTSSAHQLLTLKKALCGHSVRYRVTTY